MKVIYRKNDNWDAASLYTSAEKFKEDFEDYISQTRQDLKDKTIDIVDVSIGERESNNRYLFTVFFAIS